MLGVTSRGEGRMRRDRVVPVNNQYQLAIGAQAAPGHRPDGPNGLDISQAVICLYITRDIGSIITGLRRSVALAVSLARHLELNNPDFVA